MRAARLLDRFRTPRSAEGLYAAALRLRDLFLVVVSAAVLWLALDEPRQLAVAAALLLGVLPYNTLLRRRLQATGRVPAFMAWADQLLAAGFVLVWPQLTAPALVAGMLDVAMAAVVLDRRAGIRGAATGAAAFTAAAALVPLTGGDLPSTHLLAVPAYAISALATAYVVGTVAGQQRSGQQQLSRLLDSLEVVIYEMDARTLEVRYLSPYLERVTGRPVEEFLGDPTAFLGLVHRKDSVRLVQMVGDAAEGRRSYDLQYRIFDGQGRQRWVRNIASVESDDDGRPLIRGSIADITPQKTAEEALAARALTDGLTGLGNRDRLLEVLADDAGPRLLVFLDLDSFKRINDSLGHAAGDALLVQVAGRLRAVVRPHDAVARLGGDEFVVLLDLPRPDDAASVVRRVQQVFDAPFAVDGRTVRITAAAGAAVVPAGGSEQPALLLEQADAAMYTAKRGGPGRCAFFSAEMREAALQRLDVESEIRLALDRDEFFLVYQPIVDARSRRVVGHEALVRWQHPQRGLVPPGDFVPVAEQSGQVVDLGRWVLREACRQARRWQDQSHHGTTMSVNLSALQLGDPDLVRDVAQALADASLEPAALCLEITETALIANPQAALSALHGLRASGVRIALDDFGTGYSSLSHLHHYPVDAVKIDRSFVAHLGDGSGHDGIVTAILHLAAHMGLKVVAEGVEDEAQAARLAELGCDLLQGFAIGRPAPAPAAGLVPAMRSPLPAPLRS